MIIRPHHFIENRLLYNLLDLGGFDENDYELRPYHSDSEHLNWAQMSAYVDGMYDDGEEEKKLIDAHFEQCYTCREEVRRRIKRLEGVRNFIKETYEFHESIGYYESEEHREKKAEMENNPFYKQIKKTMKEATDFYLSLRGKKKRKGRRRKGRQK